MESNVKNQQQQSGVFTIQSSMSTFSSSSSVILTDISNFKTPQNPSKMRSFISTPKQSTHSKYSTASKETPVSSRSHIRGSVKHSAVRSIKAAKRLKAFEIEQSKSARKAQIEKEKSLKSLAKSLTVWLNFLFENPRYCGCSVDVSTGEFDRGGDVEEVGGGLIKGKRGNGPGYGVKVGVEGPLRGPKRQRNSSWRGNTPFGLNSYSGLKDSMNLVCSLDDLKDRMKDYLSSECCNQVFDAMTQVTKNIDEGRLKMRAHCPMVTDVALKERSLKILMSYNMTWLRIGLYILLGGDSLLQCDVNSDQEISFLRVVIEKQVFSHSELAKEYAYNKLVDGLYRPGYYEKLGNAILKRFLLLVIILDKAKIHSSLPTKYGIDGLDGGSPLLFSVSSNIKSSSQLISAFLSSDLMHGEGNLLAHLTVVGYKVSYQQSPLVEYDFRVNDLFNDLEDGVRLCRAIQLLNHDSSILLKMIVPSDTRKKNLVNCGLALQYLKQAGVSLCDEDGMLITEEDIANRDKELTLSLLWNMFVHLQLPLLVNKTLLSEEICKIRGIAMEESSTCTLLDMLLCWIQAIAESYNLKIDNFPSLVDGKAMWCLLDYYFRKEHNCLFKDSEETNIAVSLVSTSEYADAVHNFILSQKLTSLLGNFPEVLQVSDLLEHKGACNDRSVIILLVFLSVQLLVKRNKEQLNFHKLLGFVSKTPEKKVSHEYNWGLNLQEGSDVDALPHASEDGSKKFKAIMAWWKGMAEQTNKCNISTCTQDPLPFLPSRSSTNTQSENAAKIIQSHFRQLTESRRLRIEKTAPIMLNSKEELCIKHSMAALTIQRAWKKFGLHKLTHRQHLAATKIQSHLRRMLVEKSFKCQKKAILKIQSIFMSLRLQREFQKKRQERFSSILIQSQFRGWIKRKEFHKLRCQVLMIQGHVRGWLMRKDLLHHKEATIKVQAAFRSLRQQRQFCRQKLAAIEIQRRFRGYITRRTLLGISTSNEVLHEKLENSHSKTISNSVLKLQRWWRSILEREQRIKSAIIIQSYVRGWLKRKEILHKKESVLKIQNAFKSRKQQKAYCCQRVAAIELQRFARGNITRKRLLGAFICHKMVNENIEYYELKVVLWSVLKLQKRWRSVLLAKQRTQSAIIIQSHFRGWSSRQLVAKERNQIALIQAYWKGYLVRKGSGRQIKDLRLRMQRSAANVDDSMRLINRLIAALSELKNLKSVRSILHICSTLDNATKYSQRCCEELVSAGAISCLLKQIRAVSRSIPDQAVLKHALSTLRNLSCYPHLRDVLIDTSKCVETVLWEIVRNKEEGYIIACELMKNMCLNKKGIEAISKSPALVKRLHALVEDLSKKAANDKRHKKSGVAGKEQQIERRLKKAMEILELIKDNLK